jgi:hypothetical protein
MPEAMLYLNDAEMPLRPPLTLALSPVAGERARVRGQKSRRVKFGNGLLDAFEADKDKDTEFDC